MKRDAKFSLTRAVRFFLFILLVLVISVIVWYFLSHRRTSAVTPIQGDDIVTPKAETQEGIEHFDFKGERTIKARAEKHYAGDNNRLYLEGKVEIREIDEKGSREKIITGDKVAYDKDWQEVVLEGNANLQFGDLTVASTSLVYLKNTDTLFTDKGGSFSSRKASGKAQQLSCTFRDDYIRLEGGVEFLLRDESEYPSPLLVRAEVLSYGRKEKAGRAESENGIVTFSLGKNRGEAQEAEFELSEDEQFVRRVLLRGEVKAYLLEEKETPPDKTGTLVLGGRERDIRTDELSLTTFDGTNTVQSLKARGNCYSKSFSSSGGQEQVRSETMEFSFSREGELKEFMALTQASLTEVGKNSELERLTSGGEISVSGQGDKIRVIAEKDGEAKSNSSESEVSAREITLYPSKEIMEAAGNVKVVLKPQKERSDSVGFFSNEKPLFILAQGVRFEKPLKRLFLREGIRMWQEKETLVAEKMTMERDTGNISGEGRVRAVFPYLPKKEGAKEERIEVGGDKMTFNPKESLLVFEQNSWLKSQTIRLTAQSVRVSLREKKAEVQKINAQRKVTVIDEFREGQGEDALYDLEKETIVLTGNPMIVDKKRGVVEGDKLTFHLGDDRILVENKERDRSTTVIKRVQ